MWGTGWEEQCIRSSSGLLCKLRSFPSQTSRGLESAFLKVALCLLCDTIPWCLPAIPCAYSPESIMRELFYGLELECTGGWLGFPTVLTYSIARGALWVDGAGLVAHAAGQPLPVAGCRGSLISWVRQIPEIKGNSPQREPTSQRKGNWEIRKPLSLGESPRVSEVACSRS